MLISSAIRAYSLRIDTRPWDTEMKPPSTAMISRVPSSQKITTPLGSSTPSTGECPGRIPISPSTVFAMMLDDWPDQTTRSAETTSTCMGSAMTQPSAWSSDQRRSTSSMLPTLKKACSAMWSTLPSQIILNDSIVSASGTDDPGMFVNLVAM